MKNWKTSAAGVLAGLSQAAKAVFPEQGQLADLATALLLAVLGIFATDAKSENKRRGKIL